MGQAVQESAGEPLGAEDLCPLVEGQVGGDEDRSSLVALAEDLEQQLCAGLGQRDEAEFVDDEELEAGELLLEIEQASLVFGLYQLIVRSFGLIVERSQQNCSPGYRHRATATILPAKPIPTLAVQTLPMVKTLRAGHKINSQSMGRINSSAAIIRSLSQTNRSKK